MRIVSLDPSGNFSEKEGKGTTGWAEFKNGEVMDFGDVKAEDYSRKEDYWKEIAMGITVLNPDIVVCEGYRLYAGARGKAQINSSMETPQLIGYLRMVCYEKGIKFIEQPPSDKARVSDDILTREGIFEKKGNRYYCLGKPTNLHMRDAIRHGIFFYRYNKEVVK